MENRMDEWFHFRLAKSIQREYPFVMMQVQPKSSKNRYNDTCAQADGNGVQSKVGGNLLEAQRKLQIGQLHLGTARKY